MNFVVVYIKEAHPSDGWRVRQNDQSGIDVKQPTSETERLKVAQTACKALKLSLPCVIDNMANTTDKLWSGWPDRLFVVGHDGKVAYRGEKGPRGFDARGWETAIKTAIEKAPALPKDPPASTEPAPATDPAPPAEPPKTDDK